MVHDLLRDENDQLCSGPGPHNIEPVQAEKELVLIRDRVRVTHCKRGEHDVTQLPLEPLNGIDSLADGSGAL